MSSSIQQEMERQSIGMGQDSFICEGCKFYRGACGCDKGVFIAFVGANMKECTSYRKGMKCPHCGQNF